MKDDSHLGRNFLLGTEGDATNLILAAAGHNLRLLRAWLAWLFAFLLSLLLASHQSRPTPQTPAWRLRATEFSGDYLPARQPKRFVLGNLRGERRSRRMPL
jgi:hypothetical protein